MAKKTLVKYTSRDFNSIKQDLLQHAKRYYPENYNDFNESSFGSMMLDAVSYVGDIMSFYLDYQVNESFMETALEPANVRRIAKRYGYKYYGSKSCYGTATFYVVVPAANSGLGPNTNYTPTLLEGSKFKSTSGEMYTLTEDVDFSAIRNEVVAARFNNTTGKPTHYAIRTHGQVKSGNYYVKEITVGAFQRNPKFRVGGTAINEIVSVIDSDGHLYYEVGNLSQDVVYMDVVNSEVQSDGVRSLMKPFSVPRRFVMMQDETGTYVQFGFGSDDESAIANVADPSSVALKMSGKNYITDSSFDPSELLNTSKMGVAPANTTLKVVYGRNSTSTAGISVGQLKQVSSPKFFFPQGGNNSATMQEVRSSLEVTNEELFSSETTAPSQDEIKLKALGAYAAQNRAVTKNDYEALVYLMPKKFGAIKRATIYSDPSSTNRALSLYVVSEDVNGNFSSTSTVVKNNIKTWLNKNRMINDSVEIYDTIIINIGFKYIITVDPSYDKYGVLATINAKIKSDFLNEKLFIGEPLYMSKLYQLINDVDGVIDTKTITFEIKKSGKYSSSLLNIEDLYSNDGSYLQTPKNCILEIKYPNTDIRGAIQ
tara:strand:- start:25120 stop:26910 length:1791 start_codon:yes stop_codon:yes gene_type:complete